MHGNLIRINPGTPHQTNNTKQQTNKQASKQASKQERRQQTKQNTNINPHRDTNKQANKQQTQQTHTHTSTSQLPNGSALGLRSPQTFNPKTIGMTYEDLPFDNKVYQTLTKPTQNPDKSIKIPQNKTLLEADRKRAQSHGHDLDGPVCWQTTAQSLLC